MSSKGLMYFRAQHANYNCLLNPSHLVATSCSEIPAWICLATVSGPTKCVTMLLNKSHGRRRPELFVLLPALNPLEVSPCREEPLLNVRKIQQRADGFLFVIMISLGQNGLNCRAVNHLMFLEVSSKTSSNRELAWLALEAILSDGAPVVGTE